MSKDDKKTQPPHSSDVVITADGLILWDPVPMWDPRVKWDSTGTDPKPPNSMPVDNFGRPIRYDPHRAIEPNERNCVTMCPTPDTSMALAEYDQGEAVFDGLKSVTRQLGATHLIEE